MASFWDKLKQKYLHGNIVIRLIFINVSIFLVLRLLFAIMGLTGSDGKMVLDWIQMPAMTDVFFERPWTALTYMFVHFGLMHLLMNMLLFYFFGGLFLRWFSEMQLGIFYVVGGLSGALFFILGYLFFPALSNIENPAPLIGASAPVMALCITLSVFRPDENIPMFILGNLKLKYLAIILIALDMLSINKVNAGVGLAHMGGALSGLVLGLSLKKGHDLFAWVKPLSYRLSGLIVRKQKMRVKYRRSSSERAYRSSDVDLEYRNKRKSESDRMDVILDKVKLSGYDSLTQKEKKELFDFSNKS